jgi:SNF2 family DNA or RNA helicase
MMRTESDLHNYQRAAVEHIIDHPYCGLFLEMGLGKTVSTLTAINYLIRCFGEVGHVLIVAPLRVAQTTWNTECGIWEHLQGLTMSKVVGTAKQRDKALKVDADMYVISRDNVPWLVSKYGHLFSKHFFQMLVLDELSSFKSSKTARWKALRMVRPYFDRVVGLTGTPAPNGLTDLWAELYLLDMGERLFPTLGKFRREFTFNASHSRDYEDYRVDEKFERVISDRISDICISMKSEDYLELPDVLYQDKELFMDDELKSQYKDFERESVLELIEQMGGETTIPATSAAALSNKLLQYCNGAIYDSEHDVHHVHDLKLDALEDIVEGANGSPVLVFYSYRHDIARIEERFKGYRVRQILTERDITDWNDGKIDIALTHPAGAGHGLNLQFGGHIIVWFGLTWSLELYQQANARLHRQGQTCPVTVFHLICKGTLEEKVLEALSGKEKSQSALMDEVKYLIQKYG